jgi:hypothetical protein
MVLVFHHLFAEATEDGIHAVHFVFEFVCEFELEVVVVCAVFMIAIQELLVITLDNEESFQHIIQRSLLLSSCQSLSHN